MSQVHRVGISFVATFLLVITLGLGFAYINNPSAEEGVNLSDASPSVSDKQNQPAPTEPNELSKESTQLSSIETDNKADTETKVDTTDTKPSTIPSPDEATLSDPSQTAAASAEGEPLEEDIQSPETTADFDKCPNEEWIPIFTFDTSIKAHSNKSYLAKTLPNYSFRVQVLDNFKGHQTQVQVSPVTQANFDALQTAFTQKIGINLSEPEGCPLP